ncbi:NADH-ubiquinone oxidoreductase B12 subunit family-domain-containing protein [Poronia punctata]|nr:NADH-ubiquinone oxidoreductase B12 subunit family-domain-containing protein [Poronia punctata]
MYATRILRAQHGHHHKPNITGFDPTKFAHAAGQPRYDPWARAEAWRYTGTFSRWNRFKNAFPGLGIATVAFAVYLGYEHFTATDDHHGDAHGNDHH